MNEQAKEIVDNLIAVKGPAYYEVVMFGVTVHHMAIMLRKVTGANHKQSLHTLDILSLMWQRATTGSGFDVNDEKFTEDLMADVDGVMRVLSK